MVFLDGLYTKYRAYSVCSIRALHTCDNVTSRNYLQPLHLTVAADIFGHIPLDYSFLESAITRFHNVPSGASEQASKHTHIYIDLLLEEEMRYGEGTDKW